MDLNTEPSYKACIDYNFINVPLKINFMAFWCFSGSQLYWCRSLSPGFAVHQL